MTRTLLSLFALAVYGSVLVTPALALEAQGNVPARRADFSAKMIRKRGSAHAAALARRQETDTDTDLTSTPAPTTGQPTTRPTTTTEPATTDRDGGLLGDILTGIIGPGRPSTTTTTSDTSSSTSRSSSSSSSSSETSRPTEPSTTSTRTRSTVTVQETAVESEPVAITEEQESKSFLSKGAMLGLVITAAVLVGGAAIWTIIRKWKFSPSRHFEDRLEPLSWEPTRDTGLPPVAVARANSVNSRHGSSADDHSTRNMSTTGSQPISMAPDFPPAHDFTAGPYQSNPNQYPNPYDGYNYQAGYGGAQRY